MSQVLLDILCFVRSDGQSCKLTGNTSECNLMFKNCTVFIGFMIAFAFPYKTKSYSYSDRHFCVYSGVNFLELLFKCTVFWNILVFRYTYILYIYITVYDFIHQIMFKREMKFNLNHYFHTKIAHLIHFRDFGFCFNISVIRIVINCI